MIIAVPGLAVSQESLGKSLILCNDIDPKDTAYVALSIELDISLWSNDKKLIQGLINKGYKKVLITEEIFDLLF